MNESSATAAVHQKLPREMRIWKIADRYTNGVPDAYYGGSHGKSLWIEYKITKRKTDPLTIDVSPEKNGTGRLSPKQEEWLNSHHALGHNVAVVLIHYRPRNTRYYVLRHGQWRQKQETSALLQLSQSELVQWILDEIRIARGNK